MICKTCGKHHFALFDGDCKQCFDKRPVENLVLPKHKPKGIITKKKARINRRGIYIVRIKEGVYYNSKRKNPLVPRGSAHIYSYLYGAKKAAERIGGKVEEL